MSGKDLFVTFCPTFHLFLVADRSCSAFDIVFNKSTLEACQRDKHMNLVLIQTALEATERKGEAPIEKSTWMVLSF